jgi:hypothetical protein
MVGDGEAAGTDLGAGRPLEELGGGRLGGVVEVSGDDDRALVAEPAEGGGQCDAQGGGLGGAAGQGVGGEAGPLVLVPGANRPPGKVSSFDFRWAVTSRSCVPASAVTVTARAPRPISAIVAP